VFDSVILASNFCCYKYHKSFTSATRVKNCIYLVNRNDWPKCQYSNGVTNKVPCKIHVFFLTRWGTITVDRLVWKHTYYYAHTKHKILEHSPIVFRNWKGFCETKLDALVVMKIVQNWAKKFEENMRFRTRVWFGTKKKKVCFGKASIWSLRSLNVIWFHLEFTKGIVKLMLMHSYYFITQNK
jgi:hypothetical protein